MKREDSKLEIAHFVNTTKVLGPYTRSALWVHGCRFNCEGCIAREMNRREPVVYGTLALADIFLNVPDTEGITISGGEPFLQAEGLVHLVSRIRSARDYGVIVYTGYSLEQLQASKDKAVREFLGCIDILIDGRYMREYDDGIPYRGSSNQRIIALSDRYRTVMKAYYEEADKRNIEINVTKDRVYLVGVPSKNGLDVWEKLKAKAGAGSGI